MDNLKSMCSCLEGGRVEDFAQLLQDCHHKLKFLQEKMSESSVTHMEALIQQITKLDKDLVQLVASKHSICSSCTSENKAGLHQQVSAPQSHTMALDPSSQWKQPCCLMQECDARLRVLSSGVSDLQKTAESSTQEVLPVDVTMTIQSINKDIDRLRSIFQKVNMANVGEKVRSQTVQSKPSLADKATEVTQGERDVDSEVAPLNNNTERRYSSTEAAMHTSNLLDTKQVQQKTDSSVQHTSDRFKDAFAAIHLSCPDHFKSQKEMLLSSPKTDTNILKTLGRKHDLSTLQDPSTSDLSAAKCSSSEEDVLDSGQPDTLKAITDTDMLGKDVSRSPKTVLTIVEKDAVKLPQYAETHEKTHAVASESCDLITDTFPDANLEDITDKCHPEAQTRQNKHLIPKRWTDYTVADLLSSLEDAEVMQVGEDMERESAEELADDQERTPESPGLSSYKRRSTMQDILSQIQNMIEKSNILNRTLHMDLNWCLQSSPSEAEIRMVRTVQKILLCRYHPAQLDISAMAKQLEEAEDYKRSVVDQVAMMKSTNLSHLWSPNVLKRLEAQWSTALLDASATVQVKTAQLDQVKRYHSQLKKTKAFLEAVAAQKNKMNLHSLGSSTLQAEKFNSLLQSLEYREEMWQELLALSSHLAVHLSDAESSGALLAQLGDVQDDWRLLKGSIKRALWHAANIASQSSLLMKEAKQLKDKIGAIQESILCHDTKSTFELICLSTNLKMCNQLHVHLQSMSDSLFQFSVGQKEKYGIKHYLEELGTLLRTTKSNSDEAFAAAKQFKDWITWAKQIEYHILISKKLSLFPEEAHIQIAEMNEYRTEIMTRRSQMKLSEASEIDNEDQMLNAVEDLYEIITESLDQVLHTMTANLQEREKLLLQLDSMDAWLKERSTNRDPCAHVENVLRVDISALESKLESHQVAAHDIKKHLSMVEALEKRCKEVAEGLTPGESRYLVNRLSGIWTELDGLLARETATSWHLEELIHERTSSDEELATIKDSLKNIASCLDQQRFPMTQETPSTITLLKHMLMEHQCQVQEIQHCKEVQRSSLLCTIGELQERCKVLSIHIIEQDKYLHLKKQMEDSRDIGKEQIQQAKNRSSSLGERFRVCQVLLVELPMMKTQCQEAADQLEVIAQELYPTELNSERRRIRCTVEMFASWEHAATDEIKHLECKLLMGLHFSSELAALKHFFQRTTKELQDTEPVSPDEKNIDVALLRRWVIWRNMESGMRVLHVLAWKGKINLKSHSDLELLQDAAMQKCHIQMESLSKARESLKDYHWAAQGAIHFLHNAEITFLSAPGGFLDCTEEQHQTQQAIEALEDGFQAHIQHLIELVPQQPCLSCAKTEDLHISIVSRLLVGRAILEAQAKLRLDSLQRCELRQQSHGACHLDIQYQLTGFEAQLSECASEEVTSYDKCATQHKRAKGLMEVVRMLAGRIEELRCRCPMQGCGVGKDGELGALWRRWVSLRHGVGLLMAQTDQRVEEWKDITTSVEQCCSTLSTLQVKVSDSSTAVFTQDELQKLLAQAEQQQVGLEQERQTLASLEHRLEHALSLTTSKELCSLPGPFGETLVKIQESIARLKERNLHVITVAQMEEKERQQVVEKIGKVEKSLFTINAVLETNMSSEQHQELRKDLSAQKTNIKCIEDSVRQQYTDIPSDIGKRIETVQESVLAAEKKITEQSPAVRKVACQITELTSGLDQVKTSLEQWSANVTEAKNNLKHVWDKLDSCHSRLMLLESEVQDLVEEQPDQAHLFMDQLTHPQQLYQNVAQMAEQRTTFLNKIPTFLQEFENLLSSATCWLDEAQAWLSNPCSLLTARGLQNHANSLQMVLDDSARIGSSLKDYRPVLAEISAVCDLSAQEEHMDSMDKEVEKMQKNILEPLEQLLQAAGEVEALEDELKTLEENVPKIQIILSSTNDSSITLTEHLHNQQVILDNVHSMQKTLDEMESYKEDLRLPQEIKESLVVFSRMKVLLQVLKELEQLTQQQVILIQDKVLEEKTREGQDIALISKLCAEVSHLDGSPQGHFAQEAFEDSNSEEDVDENESCHSSSSDTLTCSIPEDPDDTLYASEVQGDDSTEMNAPSDVKDMVTVSGEFSSEIETNLESAERLRLDSMNNERENAQSGLLTMESRLDTEATGEVLKTVSLDTNEDHLAITIPAPNHSTVPTCDTFPHAKDTQCALQDIKPVAIVPTTSQPTVTHPTLEPSGVIISDCEVDQNTKEPSKVSIILGKPDKDDTEEQKWNHLHTQISQKLQTLEKGQEEHQILPVGMVPEKELTGLTSAVLQHADESVNMLSKIVTSADDPCDKEQLYLASQRVLLCLDAFTDLLLTSGGAGDVEDNQLRMLHQECVSMELLNLAEMLKHAESKTSREDPAVVRNLASLQKCLHTSQMLLTSGRKQCVKDLGLQSQHQELFSLWLGFMEDIQAGHSEIFPSGSETPPLECVLGRHVKDSSVEKTMIQKASHSLLHGLSRLLDLGEICLAEWQERPARNCSQLQHCLLRNQRFQRVLGSQLVFVQHLFHRELLALRGQEDERVQLEARAKALQQQFLEEQVASQWRLQEWINWEDNCSQLGKLIDELDVFLSSAEATEDDGEESLVQQRLHACQQILVQLDRSRPTLGWLLDQRRELQADPSIAYSVIQAGGALELRWRSAYRHTEKEVQRCGNIRDSRVRFQTDLACVSKWLLDTNKQLKIWSSLADSSEVNQESVCRGLLELLDFSISMETMSYHKESASREAARLLRLRETECPDLRAQLTKLDVTWCKLTSDLSNIQDQLQQKLLLMWPPLKLLSDLVDWLKKVEFQLNQHREEVHQDKDAARITTTLQHYQALKASLIKGQLLLDFLSQTGPRVEGMDVQALRSERTMYAQKLGALRQQWLHLQGALESQIHADGLLHHACTAREKQLEHLCRSVEQQKKQLSQWKLSTGQTQTRKILQEWETVVGRVKEVAAALLGMKATPVFPEKEHPCDVAFWERAETASRACEDLSQQIQALYPALELTEKEWTCLDQNLREVSLNTSRVRSTLQLHRTPLFSLKQTEDYIEHIQQLQKRVGQGEELWKDINQSFQSLLKTLDGRTLHSIGDRMEQERQRREDVLEDLKNEHKKTERILTLWQQYNPAWNTCSLQLEHLWNQFSSCPPQQEPQVTVLSVEKLQNLAEELQNSVADVLALSKTLAGCLQPPAANLLESQSRQLSLEVLLLNQAIGDKKKSLQEDVDNYQLFHTQLEALEQQTQTTLYREDSCINDKDVVKQELLKLIELLPSLVDVSEMSGYVSLSKQETETLHMLSNQWTHSVTHMSFVYRTLQRNQQQSQDFHQKCKELTSILEELESEPQSGFNLQEIITVQQRRQIEMITGQELLQSLLRDAVKSMEMPKGGKSELKTQVVQLRGRWFRSVSLASQHWAATREQIYRCRVYRRGMKLLGKTLRAVDNLLSPSQPSFFTLKQLQSLADGCQCVEDAVGLHQSKFTKIMEAGRRLCETTLESDSLQSEIQSIEGAWKRTNSLLEERRALVGAAVQDWCKCQDGISSIMSELDELRNHFYRQPVAKMATSEAEELIQKTDLSLRHLDGGLKDLASMKTDLFQYVATGDSALLEQQLEQLHVQWEELCTKVSLRRQEVADRLNAWTIFNDKNKEFCDWLTQLEKKVCHSADLSIEEMVEKLKKDCMEEINLFSENKSHLKQLGEQLILASDEAKQTQVCGSLDEVNQRWHNLFHHIEARVRKLKETLVTVQQLDKNMSNLRSWLSRVEAELSRPITYSVCHHQEIQRRLAEQQELQRDIEQHTEGVASVLSLCDVLLGDEDAAGATEAESDSLQETSRSLDQRWRTICAMALDRRLRIEETWRLWCKFLEDYSRFEDWLKMAEHTAANPNSGDVLYSVAKEELKKFESFQRQVHERLTQLELVNNQYRRLARENRTDRASQLRAMVHEGNRRWDTLHRRVAAILRRLKHFTGQREEFESTRESMLVWLTELDLQLTNVEHFSESDVHHKIQQLSSFQKEITINTERIDGLIVFGEGLIQRSSPQDAALIEDELEELHSYCQEVFSRLVRFHQRLSQPPIITEPEFHGSSFSMESSLELICRPWLGRSQGSQPNTPSHLLTSPLEHSGRETPVSVDSLPLEWDHTGDVGGSSSHEDDEEHEGHEEDGVYFSALSVSSRINDSVSLAAYESPRWRSPEGDTDACDDVALPTLTSTPRKQGYERQTSQCSNDTEDLKRVSLILDDEEQPEIGLTSFAASDQQSGVIERWELLQAQSRNQRQDSLLDPQHVTYDLDDVISWLDTIHPELERLLQSQPSNTLVDMTARAKELKELQKMFTRYKGVMLSINLRALDVPEQQERLAGLNRAWTRASTVLQQWDTSLRRTLMRCQDYHDSLHSLLLWLAHADKKRHTVDIRHPETPVQALKQHHHTLKVLQKELLERQTQQASLQALWSQLQPEEESEGSDETQEKLHVTGTKLKLLLEDVSQDLSILEQQRLDWDTNEGQNIPPDSSQEVAHKEKSTKRRDPSPPRSFFYRVLRAAIPFHLLLLLLLLLPCLVPQSERDSSCSEANNFARSFHPMLRYTNGPPPT
uniref:nesprin-2 isoform X2 n=1 Tax=Doryrhamphus excisus TaxID=161450 RepID=UPI0025ADE23B|nr:nesprin-2 isoform X2 [Doryrhamphus excisus]